MDVGGGTEDGRLRDNDGKAHAFPGREPDGIVDAAGRFLFADIDLVVLQRAEATAIFALHREDGERCSRVIESAGNALRAGLEFLCEEFVECVLQIHADGGGKLAGGGDQLIQAPCPEMPAQFGGDVTTGKVEAVPE